MNDHKRIELITKLLDGHPKLFNTLFDARDLTTMRGGPEEIIESLKGYSRGEKTLCLIALDIWKAPYGGGGALLTDIIQLPDEEIELVASILLEIARE
jgi:hypothetical protein